VEQGDALTEAPRASGTVTLTNLAKEAAGTNLAKNMVALGVLSGLFNLPDEQMRDDAWETVAQVPIDDVPMWINRYFDEHPEQMLGEVGVGHALKQFPRDPHFVIEFR